MERPIDPEKTNPYFHPDATQPPVPKRAPIVDHGTFKMIERAQREIAETRWQMEEALRGLYQVPIKVMDYERLYEYEGKEMYRVRFERGGEAKEILIERKDGGKLGVLPS
ncbi:MAG TPA: hypothetical protein VJ553_04030 [Candidatus Paceibacterota bacterium]|nr:hypothetical protein [Candidatus Paceibacterota bacterium]